MTVPPIVLCGKRLNKNPIKVPRIPTMVKKQKFIMLTAVLEINFLFVKCNTGTKRELKLALAASMQKIIATKSVLMSKNSNIHNANNEQKVMTEAFFKNLTLWLWNILQIYALIMLNTAAITAIQERTIAAFEVVIKQKSSRNCLPIIVCIA